MKKHKVRASERTGCLHSSKVSARQDKQFPYFMGHPILSTSPYFPASREKRPNKGPVNTQIFGKGSSDLPMRFWGWALEGTFSRPRRRAPPIFRQPVEDITQKKPQIDQFWGPFWVFLGCFGLGHPPGERHKDRAIDRRGCLNSSKVSARQDKQFPYCRGHPILSTSPYFPGPRERRRKTSQ